jgi:uncharacterized protein (TIGR03382 family)
MVEALLSANIQTWLIPLLLVHLGPVAVFAKVYAAAPMLILGRWRELAVSVALLAITAPLLPWSTFVGDLPLIAEYFRMQTPYAIPVQVFIALLPVAGAALWAVGRWNAAWLIVPAAAAQQWYYTTLVMPTRSSVVAFLVCIPIPGSGLLALFGLALSELLGRRRASRVEPRLAAEGPP